MMLNRIKVITVRIFSLKQLVMMTVAVSHN